jgi:iron(III) transport system substrate-binding protein
MKKLVAILLLLAVSAHAQSPELIAAAKKEGKVVWYTGLIVNQIVRPLCDAFQAKYGIQATYSRHDENELAMVFATETRAGRMQVDVMGSVAGVTDTIPASEMEPFTPEGAADYPPDSATADNIWHSTNVIIHTVGINTDLVKGDDVPHTLQDLLNPKWKGKIAWSSGLGMAGPPGFIGMILTTMGPDAGMAYLKQLSAQKIVNVQGTPRAVLDQVIAGEYPIALQIVSYHASISAAQGAPTAWLKMEPVIANHNYVGLVRHAPHPNAARLFIDFALSEEGQTVFRKAGYIPANPKIPAGYPDTKPQDGGYKSFLLTPENAGPHYKEWLKVYSELFK